MIPDEQRVMPQTVPDSVVGEHQFGCTCPPCLARPVALRRRIKRVARGAQR